MHVWAQLQQQVNLVGDGVQIAGAGDVAAGLLVRFHQAGFSEAGNGRGHNRNCGGFAGHCLCGRSGNAECQINVFRNKLVRNGHQVVLVALAVFNQQRNFVAVGVAAFRQSVNKALLSQI